MNWCFVLIGEEVSDITGRNFLAIHLGILLVENPHCNALQRLSQLHHLMAPHSTMVEARDAHV